MTNTQNSIKALLEKAGLIASGIVVIKSKENRSRQKQDESGTWIMTDDPFDPADSRYTTTPVMNDSETLILGNWENDLTPEEVDALVKYGIPRFNVAHPRIGMRDSAGKLLPDTAITIFSGKQYDCSDPKQFAEVKILLHNEIVALKREDCETYSTNFYWHKEEEEIKKKNLMLELRKKAILLADDNQRLDTKGRAAVVRYLTFTQPKLKLAYSMTPLKLEMTFKELCIDNPREVLQTLEVPNLNAEVAFYELNYQGLLMMEGEKVYRTSGVHNVKQSFFAETKEHAVKMLSSIENEKLLHEGINSVYHSYGLIAQLKKETTNHSSFSDSKTASFLDSLTKGKEKDVLEEARVSVNFSPNIHAVKITKSALIKLTVEELKKYAQEHKIELAEDLKKDGIIEVILSQGGAD